MVALLVVVCLVIVVGLVLGAVLLSGMEDAELDELNEQDARDNVAPLTSAVERRRGGWDYPPTGGHEKGRP